MLNQSFSQDGAAAEQGVRLLLNDATVEVLSNARRHGFDYDTVPQLGALGRDDWSDATAALERHPALVTDWLSTVSDQLSDWVEQHTDRDGLEHLSYVLEAIVALRVDLGAAGQFGGTNDPFHLASLNAFSGLMLGAAVERMRMIEAADSPLNSSHDYPSIEEIHDQFRKQRKGLVEGNDTKREQRELWQQRVRRWCERAEMEWSLPNATLAKLFRAERPDAGAPDSDILDRYIGQLKRGRL